MWRETGIWQDVSELPDALAATLEAADGVSETAAFLGADGVQRIVATGNGALSVERAGSAEQLVSARPHAVVRLLFEP